MWDNYFAGIGLGSDYGTVMEYYSRGVHVDTQVYFDAGGSSWYRTASYNSGWQSWQRYVTENGGTWGINITGSAGTVDGVDSSQIVYGINSTKSAGVDGRNINAALPCGFYDGYNMTGAPTGSDYYHLIVNRHQNEGNNYQMQFAGMFFNVNGLYYRIINNGTPSSWFQIMHSSNSPYAYNMNQYVRTTDSVTFYDIYSNAWIRNNNANQGLYNQATTMHWSSKDNGYWDVSSTTTVASIRFFTGSHIGNLRGYVYANTSNEIGFLDPSGNWIIRCASTSNTYISGDLTAGRFFESSDMRIKELVHDDYKVEGIESIRPKLYIKDGKEELGYFAQDFQQILPTSVFEGTDGFLNLSYTQVHTAKIAYLEAKIQELENKLKQIQNENN